MRRIAQIELSSKCNLTCPYCPHHKIERAKVNMTKEVFLKSLDWVEYFNNKGTQGEIVLHGLGDPLLNKQFKEFVIIARKRFPENKIMFSTNAIELNDELINLCKILNINVHISLHRPDLAYKNYFKAKDKGVIEFAGINPISEPNNWAGQVDFPARPKTECTQLRGGWGIILSNGDITVCCVDAEGIGKVGTVDSEKESLKVKPFKLCKTCDQNKGLYD